MPRLLSHALLMITALIWGVTFVFQTTGMDQGLGPFGFTAFRFLAGSIALLPLAIWEARATPLKPLLVSSGPGDYRKIMIGTLALGVLMFCGSALQQVSLGITSVANTAFLTTLYVPMVPLFGLVLFARNIRGLRWLAVGICMVGSWLMSGASPMEAVIGDIMVVIGAVFWAAHIMIVGAMVQRSKTPFQLAFLQTFITMVLSFVVLPFLETFTMAQVMAVLPEILFAGVMSTAVGFTLQLVAQQHCSDAAAAIILSLEGAIAAIAGWVLLDQTMMTSAIIGAALIFMAILLVEL
ncbi:MAG: DMT family transporter, partial [Alphaproteobacteria bacterium]|nr:DMT family transporter [Alphaproteobacteria bacterium]